MFVIFFLLFCLHSVFTPLWPQTIKSFPLVSERLHKKHWSPISGAIFSTFSLCVYFASQPASTVSWLDEKCAANSGAIKAKDPKLPARKRPFSHTATSRKIDKTATAINWFIGREIARKGLKAHLGRSNLWLFRKHRLQSWRLKFIFNILAFNRQYFETLIDEFHYQCLPCASWKMESRPWSSFN